jgi:hypothetical protein
VHDVAIQFIADIRTREKELVDELHEIYGQELMEYVQRKSEMQANLDSLKSTCSLTELVLKGKDIELLLLKKQVQDKLSCLSDVTLKDLPNTVHKNITFKAGSMELGSLQDMDRPGLHSQLSCPSLGKSGGGGGAGNSGKHIRTTETQTEKSAQGEARMVSRYIQTQRESAPVEGEGQAGEGGRGRKTVATATERVVTEERGSNTESLSRNTSLASSLDDGTPPDPYYTNGDSQGGGVAGAEGSVPLDPTSSPSARRARRRRDRQRKPIEVSVRPTTHHPSGTTTTTVVSTPDGYGPILTYSSSIEENHYTLNTQ